MGPEEFVLKSRSGQLTARLRAHGATISHLIVQDRHGVPRDVVQGFDTLAEQLNADSAQNPYYGTIGRFCNRIGLGKFVLGDRTFQLPINNGPNSLHGGIVGFDKRRWDATQPAPDTVVMTLLANDGEEGYPAELLVTVTYTLVEPAELRIDYDARIPDNFGDSDTVTAVNLTTHSYFNLNGATTNILGHDLWFPDCRGHLELTPDQIPTWKVISPAMNPAMDFTSGAKAIGRDISKVSQFKGYDHFYVVRDPVGLELQPLKRAAVVVSPQTGIVLELWTTAMGVQLYTGNWLDGTIAAKKSSQADAATYGQFHGFCLEASAPPDAINSPDPSIRNEVVLKKGMVWRQTNCYRFSTV